MHQSGELPSLDTLPYTYTMRDEHFETWVENSITELPEWVREKLVNVAFLIEDEPSEELRAEEGLLPDETLFGHYVGVPLADRGDDAPLFPDTITIFKTPILETYTDEADIRACIRNTIWHEVAHYFGHDEEWVEQEEIRRGKTL